VYSLETAGGTRGFHWEAVREEGRLRIQGGFKWPVPAMARTTVLALVLGPLCQAVVPARARADEPASGYFRESVLPGPPDLVWRLLTTEKGLESWLVPQAEIDLRIGGAVRTQATKDGKMGDPQTTAVSRILALVPGRRFSVKVEQAPAQYPFANVVQGTWYDVYVDPQSGGRTTRVRCVGNGLATGFAAYAVKPVFDQGVGMAFEQLRKAVVAQGPKPGTQRPAPASQAQAAPKAQPTSAPAQGAPSKPKK
jgi:uncharacterized protein YndB with AHSA1/START domain